MGDFTYKGMTRWKMKGISALEKKLDDMMDEKKANTVLYPVMTKASNTVLTKLKQDMLVFRDTGATIKEAIVENPKMDKHGVRMVKLGWSSTGDRQRWRMIHLNEYGYTRYGRRYNPRGMGVIGRSVDSSMSQYQKDLERGIKSWLKI